MLHAHKIAAMSLTTQIKKYSNNLNVVRIHVQCTYEYACEDEYSYPYECYSESCVFALLSQTTLTLPLTTLAASVCVFVCVCERFVCAHKSVAVI